MLQLDLVEITLRCSFRYSFRLKWFSFKKPSEFGTEGQSISGSIWWVAKSLVIFSNGPFFCFWFESRNFKFESLANSVNLLSDNLSEVSSRNFRDKLLFHERRHKFPTKPRCNNLRSISPYRCSMSGEPPGEHGYWLDTIELNLPF